MNNLFNDDCRNILKTISSESVDLIVTDPPYLITPKGNKKNRMLGGFIANDNLARSGKVFENNEINCSEYFSEFFRVLKDQTHCYVMCNNINLYEMIDEGQKAGFKFVKSLIWKKGNNKIYCRWYMGCFEYILLFRKGGAKPINELSTPDILDIPINKLKNEDGSNTHNTEKPVELMKVLVRNSSNVGETVLDPFMGIGSTGIACSQLNRNFIGIEINSTYFNVAKNRIEAGEQKVSLW